MTKTVEIRMQTHSTTPARITISIRAQKPEGRVVVPGVKPLKALTNDAAAANKTTVATIGPMIAKITEYIILVKIA